MPQKGREPGDGAPSSLDRGRFRQGDERSAAHSTAPARRQSERVVTDEKLIAVIGPEGRSRVRIRTAKLRGRSVVDVRFFVSRAHGGPPLPTKRGIMFSRELLPELIEALARAGQELPR